MCDFSRIIPAIHVVQTPWVGRAPNRSEQSSIKVLTFGSTSRSLPDFSSCIGVHKYFYHRPVAVCVNAAWSIVAKTASTKAWKSLAFSFGIGKAISTRTSY
jgi:hypothetical protein